MGNWKKTVAALAALPVMVAGLALGPSTAMAAEGDGTFTLASLNFNDDNGFAGAGAVATKQGNVTLVDGNDGTKAAKLGNGAWFNVTKSDGTPLLKGLDDVTISYDRKADTSGNTGWTVFAASGNAAQTYGNEHYLGFLDKTDSLTVERYNNSGKRDSAGNLVSKASRDGWNHVELTLNGKNASLKVDGAEVATNANGPKLSDILGASGGVLQLGKANWGNGEYFSGLIDNLTITTNAQGAAQQAAAAIDLGDLGNVTGDLALPATGANGAAITWKSDNESVISSTGKVTPTAEDTAVTLTATATVAGASATKTFQAFVPAAITDPAQAAEKLLVDYQLTAGAKLPTQLYGATVAWKSSDAALVKDDGTVLGADGDAEKTVDLTATVALNGKTATKTFAGVRVMPKSAQTLAAYTRDSSADGGIRVAGALHLALSADGKTFDALNQNYGVDFAEAKYNTSADGKSTSYQIRDLTDPYLFRMADGKYAYVAIVTDQSGARLDPGTILFSTSSDLVQWSGKPNDDEIPQQRTVTTDTTPFDAGSLTAGYDAAAKNYRIGWTVGGVAKYATTTDFTTFSDVKNGSAFAKTTPDLNGIDKAVAGNTMTIDPATAKTVSEKLGRVTNTGVEAPKTITVETGKTTADDLLKQIKGGETLDNGLLSKGATATATYSDGSTHDFRVNWNADDLAKIDVNTPGEYTVNGTIDQQNFSEGAMMKWRADPNVVYWKGKYYFIATNEGADKNIYIRSASTMAGLKDASEPVSDGAGGHYVPDQDHFLWGDKDDTGHDGYHWAPELHVIDGKLYCFFAQYPTGKDGDPKVTDSPNWAGPSAYVYELKSDDADPLDAANWTEHRVLAKDGGVLSPHGLSIDMTYFEVNGKSYIAWSQGNQTTKGALADVSIAEVTKDKPWQAITDPVRIARCEYGWELGGVNEGPNVLVNDGKVYMVFSAQYVGTQYATGMMIANVGDDLTKASSWTKSNYPWMHNGVFPGQSGLGHNSYFTDPYGDIYNVYHFGGGGNRHASIVPIHFRTDGSPILDMKVSEELDQSKKNVTLKVVVTNTPVSSDASLKSLAVAGASVDLEKAGSADGASLEVANPSAVKAEDVTAVATDAGAAVEVAVTDGVVTVTVTAADGTTVKTYTVKLVKKDSGENPNPPAGEYGVADLKAVTANYVDNGQSVASFRYDQSGPFAIESGRRVKLQGVPVDWTVADVTEDAAKGQVFAVASPNGEFTQTYVFAYDVTNPPAPKPQPSKPAVKPGSGLSVTGVAVAGVMGAVALLAAAGIGLTVWRKRRA